MRVCGDCPNLKITPLMNAAVAGCDETGFVVPHMMESSPRKATITFTRIPLSCPRSDTVKSEKPAAKKYHITKEYDL